MVNLIMFYFDQPVKRLWYVISPRSSAEEWDNLYRLCKDTPNDVPNEVYKLMAGEHKHVPKLQVALELSFETTEAAQEHCASLVKNDIERLRTNGATDQAICETLINVDDAVRNIRMLRSAVAVNAGLYYDHGVTAISDEAWDRMADNLWRYQNLYPYVLPFVNFFDKEFADFTPDTGFHLPYRSEPIYSTVLRAVEFLAQRK